MSLNHTQLVNNRNAKSPLNDNQTKISANQIIPNIKPKVLLIEDDRTLRRIVRAEIGEHCNLLMAGNASLGATLFKSERPDLAFIDISLPDSNGYNVLDWMLKVNSEAFAVMFSGHTDKSHVHKSIELGAKGFVSKPFDVNKMLFFIKQCMNY